MLLRVNRKKKRVEYRKEHLDSDGHYRSSPIEDSQARGEARFAVQGVACHRWASQLAREGSPSSRSALPRISLFFCATSPQNGVVLGARTFFLLGKGSRKWEEKKGKIWKFYPTSRCCCCKRLVVFFFFF